MGTVISLDLPACDPSVPRDFFDQIEELENRLSLFRPNSDLSRLAIGEIPRSAVSWPLQPVLELCDRIRSATDGCFEHEPRKLAEGNQRNGLDPGGLAKGWIIEQASSVLTTTDLDSFLVNAGGDVLAHRSADASPWHVGIRHPSDPDAVVAIIELHTGAAATSGSYERPGHIWSDNPRVLKSASVVGPSLAYADALATAVFASGRGRPSWWSRFESEYGLLTVSDGPAPSSDVSINYTLRWWPPTDNSATGIRLAAPSALVE